MAMSVLESKLKQFLNEEVVVVMRDNRAFRGTLVEFDHEALVLRNVVEAVPTNAAGWEEPTVSTGVVDKVVTWHGVFSHADNRAEVVRLKDVVILKQGILRIWEFSGKNIAKPEHTGIGDEAAESRGPASRVSRRAL